jgi:hypothetical protein
MRRAWRDPALLGVAALLAATNAHANNAVAIARAKAAVVVVGTMPALLSKVR